MLMPGLNPLVAAWRIVKSLVTTRSPRGFGTETVDHQGLTPVLEALAARGVPALEDHRHDLDAYLDKLEGVAPERLTRDEALAFWINLYNAGAAQLALETHQRGEASVLRIPGGFSAPRCRIDGEHLSLDDVEHGKIRRFKDPRIHGALVCGALSCPTLRATPYTGSGLSGQLDDQMRKFLAGGGAVLGSDGTVALSRMFLWYGGDLVRPHRMPSFVPATRKALLQALTPWLPKSHQDASRVVFQDYDWGLGCKVG